MFLHAQSLVFRQLDVENGLPCQETYETLQASDGFLWIATDRGVCRYNGRGFQCFSVEDGLLDNAVLGLYEDRGGNIWFPLALGGLNYWDGQSIKEYKYNDTLLKFIPNSGSIDRIVFDEKGSLWVVGFKEGILLEIDKYGESIPHVTAGLRGYFYIWEFANEDLLSGPFYAPSDYSISKADSSILVFKRPMGSDTLQLPFLFSGSARTEVLKQSDSSYLIAIDSILLQIKHGELKARHDFKRAVVGIEATSQDGIWITTEEGLFNFKEGLEGNYTIYLSGNNPCFVAKDFEGGLWVNSLSAGLFYLPPLRWQELALNNSAVSKLALFANEIAFSDFKGSISLLKQTKNGVQVDTILKNAGYSPILCVDGDTLYAGSNLVMRREQDCQSKKTDLQRVLSYSKGRSGKVYAGTITGYVELLQAEEVYSSADHGFSQRVTAIAEMANAEVLIGTGKGLYRKVGQSFLKISDFAVVDIVQAPKETYWILSDGQGTYRYQNGELELIEHLNLTSNLSTCGFWDSQGNLWIGTTKGLNRVEFLSEKPLRTRSTQFDISDGLPSNQINSLIEKNKALVIGTNKGIVRINLDQLDRNRTPPKLAFTGIRINNQIQNEQAPIKLSPSENELTFEFEGISFRDARELSYKYKLEGQDELWQSTDQNKVNYTNLKAGNYTFLLSVKNGDGQWSEVIESQSFSIKQSLFGSLWFWLGVWLLFAALVVFISFKIVFYVKRNEANKRELLIAEQVALKAQMKPHFIFNALNAIQLFIARNQKKEANDYLSNFSQLMRSILDGSSKGLISLSEELAMLENYLKLEMLRLKDKVTYDIQVGKEICAERVLIPPMLIQPILENALWHGLSSKETAGLLQLRIGLRESNLQIEVEDNGIGREMAAKQKADNRRKGESIGLQNIIDRLKIAYPKRVDQPVTIIDLFDGLKPMGTRVILLIPIDLNT
ncbi:sensor histidine kinase [Croceimicrobium hydrocarbonivorans]|uniref:Histidine kinase n=1 Tax=Croceimicrobium hydrocarbonivorans TaxID=2761580 RepID=A0A7H0VHK7_9FLAO|nr:sensor histidine kinase [Croceimicrobium hydrocarbonivorans]QNR25205.1 histidine kinase [Croceimicrobium hydrocarbonivorans]